MAQKLVAFLGACIVVVSPSTAATQTAVSASAEQAKLVEAHAIIEALMPPEQRAHMIDKLLGEISAQLQPAFNTGAITDPGLRAIVDEYEDRALEQERLLLQKEMPNVLEANAIAYTHEFSLAELKSIHAFAQTPAGRHYLERSTSILGDPAVAKANTAVAIKSQELQNALLPEMKEKIAAYLKAHPDVAAKINDEDSEPSQASDDVAAQQTSTCQGALGGAHPVTAEAKIKACTDLISSGQLKAEDLADTLVDRSRGYGAQKAIDRQAADLDAATKADPTYPKAWAQSCSFHTWSQPDLTRAVQECSKAIELAPKDPNGWTFRGDIYLSTKDYQKAIQDYDKAIEFDPTWMWPWVNRGEAYLRTGNIDRAISDYEMAMKVAPDYAMGQLDRGIARVKENQLDAAFSDFEEALKTDPKCAACLYGLGIVKGRKGDKGGEAADIQEAKSMNPTASEDFDVDGVFAD